MKHLLISTIGGVLLVTTAFDDPIHDAVKNGDLAGVQADGEEPKARLAPVPLREDALLFRQLAIPKPFLTTHKGHTFGGDLRIGDLNGDGRCDFLVYRCNDGAPKGAHMGGMKPAFMGAFDLDGKPLWQVGMGGNQPSRPMSVAIKDWTGDGADDVICFWHRPQPGLKTDWQSLADVAVQLRDGRTGKVLREVTPKAVTDRRRKDPVGANWVHQRLLIANFRGTPEPRDVVVKLGDTYVAMDERFNVLWTYRSEWVKYSQCPAYIPAVGDIDGDGRDELLTGYHLIDHDGRLLWKNKLGANMDSVTIDRWQSKLRAICSGFGHVMDARGKVILSLGKEQVPHGQGGSGGGFSLGLRWQRDGTAGTGAQADSTFGQQPIQQNHPHHRTTVFPDQRRNGAGLLEWTRKTGPAVQRRLVMEPSRGQGLAIARPSAT